MFIVGENTYRHVYLDQTLPKGKIRLFFNKILLYSPGHLQTYISSLSSFFARITNLSNIFSSYVLLCDYVCEQNEATGQLNYFNCMISLSLHFIFSL